MILLWLLLLQSDIGLSVVSKAELTNSPVRNANRPSENSEEYAPKHWNKTRARDTYIPVYLKENHKRIEARIPVIIGNKSEAFRAPKRKASKSHVPVVRGAAVPLRADISDLPSEQIEGLDPPSQTALENWITSHSSHPQALTYPDSNGYYPNVGDGDGGYPSTTPRPYYGVPSSPRPTYGVPSPGPSNWGCPSGPWGNNPRPDYPSYPSGYPPSQNYPNSQYPPSNYPQHPPSSGNYPQSDYPPSNYPNYPSGNPPSQNYPSGRPPSQNYPASYPGYQMPSTGYPSQSNHPYQSNGGQSPWQYSGRPWSKQDSGKGQWIPCRPFDLTDNDRQAKSTSGCPQNIRQSNFVRFESSATPASKIDDKNNFDPITKDIEMVKI